MIEDNRAEAERKKDRRREFEQRCKEIREQKAQNISAEREQRNKTARKCKEDHQNTLQQIRTISQAERRMHDEKVFQKRA